MLYTIHVIVDGRPSHPTCATRDLAISLAAERKGYVTDQTGALVADFRPADAIDYSDCVEIPRAVASIALNAIIQEMRRTEDASVLARLRQARTILDACATEDARPKRRGCGWLANRVVCGALLVISLIAACYALFYWAC